MTTSLLHVDTSRSDVSPLNLVITNGSLQLRKSPLLGGVRHQQYFDTFSFIEAMKEQEKMIIQIGYPRWSSLLLIFARLEVMFVNICFSFLLF